MSYALICVQEKGRVEEQVGEAHRELGRERRDRREQEEQRRSERDLWEQEQQHANHVLQELSREVASHWLIAASFDQ